MTQKLFDPDASECSPHCPLWRRSSEAACSSDHFVAERRHAGVLLERVTAPSTSA
jgi:hypothetical protein